MSRQRLTEKGINRNPQIRERLRRDLLAPPSDDALLVTPVLRLGIDFNFGLKEVNDPQFGDAVPGVQGSFDFAIFFERIIGHFNQ